MSWLRKAMVYCLVLLLLAGHLGCMLLRREWWPLSHYAMYARPLQVPISFIEIKGISAEDPEVEVPLPKLGGPRFVRVGAGLSKMVILTEKGVKSVESLEEALFEIAGLYNYHREAANMDIVLLDGVRVYRQIWVPDPNPGNGGWRLESREIVAEAHRGEHP